MSTVGTGPQKRYVSFRASKHEREAIELEKQGFRALKRIAIISRNSKYEDAVVYFQQAADRYKADGKCGLVGGMDATKEGAWWLVGARMHLIPCLCVVCAGRKAGECYARAGDAEVRAWSGSLDMTSDVDAVMSHQFGCCAALCRAVLCCAVLCCAVLCCVVLCCVVLCLQKQMENVLTAATFFVDAAEAFYRVDPLGVCSAPLSPVNAAQLLRVGVFFLTCCVWQTPLGSTRTRFRCLPRLADSLLRHSYVHRVVVDDRTAPQLVSHQTRVCHFCTGSATHCRDP